MRVSKSKEKAHVVFVYKNFAINAGISHIGLGVSALNNAKVFMKHGVRASVLPIVKLQELIDYIQQVGTVTDVVISAPWIRTDELVRLIRMFPMVEFAVNCHSNVGFLQADSNGVRLLREYIDVEQGNLNFRIGGNSAKFNRWLREAYQAPSLYLPNMYYLDYSHRIRPSYYDGGVLRIGAFGAIRPQKNLMSAAGAALVLANEIKADVEFWISSGRAEGGGHTILNAIREMLVGVPGIKLMEFQWKSWSLFRDTLRRMHLLYQVSYTESFNMVTADGIAEGIPSVVSEAIDWVPRSWQANVDDVDEMARVGRHLLYDRHAASDGLKSLEHHNSHAFRAWMTALNISECGDYKGILQDPFLL